MPDRDRRLLFVHAHPDDESIATGATMARYAAEGVRVTLVTCTLGEEGEVIPDHLHHLTADRDEALRAVRQQELAAATAALGVTDVRLLGGPGRFRDSGMAGTATAQRPDCFSRADLQAAADPLVDVLRELRPHVAVSYDDRGGYGHPDHVMAHRVLTYAAALAAVPSYRPVSGPAWDVPKIYWTARPVSSVRTSAAHVAASAEAAARGWTADDAEDYAVPDEAVTCTVDGTPYVERKAAALRAHATQVEVAGDVWALSNRRGVQLDGREHFRLAKGRPAAGPDGRESDLFAGISAPSPVTARW